MEVYSFGGIALKGEKIMTFKEYVAYCNKILKDSPETADFLVVFSSDDEGNEYNPVHFYPCLGLYERREFHTDSEAVPDEPNAICIN
jgi:hypothetical protein